MRKRMVVTEQVDDGWIEASLPQVVHVSRPPERVYVYDDDGRNVTVVNNRSKGWATEWLIASFTVGLLVGLRIVQ